MSRTTGVRLLTTLGILLAATASLAGTPQTLVDLVRAGQREAVLAAITSPDIDVDAPSPDGSTALMWTIHKVDHEMVRALLKAGAKPNVINRFGASPLTEAVKLGDFEMVRMLLDAGADANTANQDNQTALMLAAAVGSPDIAKALIKRGARVNEVEQFRDQTAVMWAAAQNHPDVVELLIANGADVTLRAKHDDWPRQITSEPRAQFRQTGGLTALLYATRSGCYRCAVAIVKAGADVNQPNPDGVTPLINALDNRAFDIAMFLLDQGANPGAWDMSGRTPLYVAVDMNSLKHLDGFAGFDGSPVHRDPNTATALDVVKRLLSMGVDPNHQLTRMRPNGYGRGRFSDYMLRGGTAPLMVAALRHDTDAIKELLAHGAEVDLPNVFQITPLMAAVGMSGSLRAGLGSSTAAATREDPQPRMIETVDLLLDAGADINARVIDSRTRTAKMTSYIPGRDHEGKTALFAAAEAGLDRVVKHLLERGADPTIRDDAGKLALDYARSGPPAGPSGAPPPPPESVAARAATVALLESRMQASAAR